jgi:putative flippase GtrA
MGGDTLLIAKITSTPLFRFLLVGGAAFFVDAGIVGILTHFGVGALGARIVSISVSVIFTFVLNRTLTFQANGRATWQEFSAYVGASLLGIAINYGIFAGCLKLGMTWLPAMGLGTALAAMFNFFVYRRIFKKPEA